MRNILRSSTNIYVGDITFYGCTFKHYDDYGLAVNLSSDLSHSSMDSNFQYINNERNIFHHYRSIHEFSPVTMNCWTLNKSLCFQLLSHMFIQAPRQIYTIYNIYCIYTIYNIYLQYTIHCAGSWENGWSLIPLQI